MNIILYLFHPFHTLSGTHLYLGVSRLKDSSIHGYKKISSQNSLGKTAVKPVSSNLVNAVMPKTASNTNDVAKVNNRRSSEPIELNGKENIFISVSLKSLFYCFLIIKAKQAFI